MKSNDLTGKKFGKLTVLGKTEERKNGNICWHCICECGNSVIVRTTNLNSGNTKSCGCVQKEKARKTIGKYRKPYEKTGLCKFNNSDENKKRAKERYPETAKSMGLKDGTMASKLNDTIPKNNTSGVRGVYCRYGKFIAAIRFKGKLHTIGTYDTLEKATEARKKAEEFYFAPVAEQYKAERNRV